MSIKLKPGQKAPASGRYEIVGPRGGKTGKGVTIIKGEPLPPARKSGQTYVISSEGKPRTLKRSVETAQLERDEIRSVVRAIHVIPEAKGRWTVKSASARERHFVEKPKALKFARKLGEERGTRVIVHDKNRTAMV